MDDHRLALAEALLAKARSSSFERERESFAAGAYRQLAAVLHPHPSPRRPEGVDLRAGANAPSAPPARPSRPGRSPGRPVVVDLVARRYRDLERAPAAPGVVVDVTV